MTYKELLHRPPTPMPYFRIIRRATGSPQLAGPLVVIFFLSMACCAQGQTTSPAPATATAVELGKRIVAFCQSQSGKQVGDGECSSLAGEALAKAGARGINGASPGGDDYIWGDLAGVIEAKGKTNYDRETQARKALPGDIIQFRDAGFAGSDGTHSTRSHHTALVVTVTGYGKQIQVLEQNFGGHRSVIKNTLNVDDMHSGWIRIYHPVAGG